MAQDPVDHPQQPLYSDWRLEQPDERPDRLQWAPELAARFSDHPDGVARAKEQWGVRQLGYAILDACPGCRIFHRGDIPASDRPYDWSFPLPGDIEASWDGRTFILEAKAYLPRVAHSRWRQYGPDQGLPAGKALDYSAASRLEGHPWYCCWLWDSGHGPKLAGKRVDLLGPPDHESGVFNMPGKKQHYWALRQLWTIEQIAEDVAKWSGAPFQAKLDL